LCHLDIAPRNFLWLEDGSICFIDWASAGFYPRFFEICAQRVILGKEGNFNRLILDSLGTLSDSEETQAALVLKAFRNMLRCHL
jgi:Ser/Thr protein kinase RdoA (MazF antagonist)